MRCLIFLVLLLTASISAAQDEVVAESDVLAVTLQQLSPPAMLAGLRVDSPPTAPPALCEGLFEDNSDTQIWQSTGQITFGETAEVESLNVETTDGYVTSTAFPMLCLAGNFNEQDLIAAAPDGTESPALLYVAQVENRSGFVMQLPLHAYAQPGLWMLRPVISSQEIPVLVDIPQAESPFYLRYPPDEPGRSYVDTMPRKQVLVGGFVPDERVFGLVLNADGFNGEFTFQVDDRGHALLELDTPIQGALFFVGEFGSVIAAPPTGSITDVDGNIVAPTEFARLVYDSYWGIGSTRTYAAATPDATATLAPTVEATPEATAEIEPTPQATTAPTSVPAPLPGGVPASVEELTRPRVCAGSPPPRLTVGGSGRVTPGLPNNLRAQPSVNSERLARIPGSGTFSVVGGPECGGSLTWWQVTYNGITGWTVEGEGNTYWVEPA